MKKGRDYWSRHIAAWRQSGQSRKAYCEEHGLSYWSMRNLDKQAARDSSAGESETGRTGADRGRSGARRRSSADRVGGGRPVRAAAMATPAGGAVARGAGRAGEQLMIHLELGEARIFVRPGATDMRKQINGLVLLVQEEMRTSPFETALFVFCNAQRQLLKAVYWDRTGFCLWMKRLEKCGFRKLCRLISGNSGRLVKAILSVFGGKIKMAGSI